MLYPKDPSLRVESRDEGIEISWRWGHKQGKEFLYMRCIFLAMALIGPWIPDTSPRPMDLTSKAILFGFFVAASVLLIVIGWNMYLARVKMHVSANELKIRGGLNIRTQVFDTDGAKQFFVRKSHSGRYVSLYFLDHDCNCYTITGKFGSPLSADHVCRELQTFYGLEDIPVFGNPKG